MTLQVAMNELKMNITIRKSTMVPPISETPKEVIWNANVDLVVPRMHVASVYFYRPTGSPDFFDGDIIREAIGKSLVPFYPMGGRLIRQEDGRVAINCQGQGVLFVEADSEAYIDDFGDFACHPAMQELVPKVKPTEDLESYPLLVLQVSQCNESSLPPADLRCNVRWPFVEKGHSTVLASVQPKFPTPLQ